MFDFYKEFTLLLLSAFDERVDFLGGGRADEEVSSVASDLSADWLAVSLTLRFLPFFTSADDLSLETLQE